MSSTVQVLYDFDAQDGSSELSIRAGEFLTLTRQDVGDGWWEGVRSNGQQGLFPESYVQLCAISVVEEYGPPAGTTRTAEETRRLFDKKRRQLQRRHTYTNTKKMPNNSAESIIMNDGQRTLTSWTERNDRERYPKAKDTSPPSIPPPPFPSQFHNDWDIYRPTSNGISDRQRSGIDEFDDDWSDDDDSNEGQPTSPVRSVLKSGDQGEHYQRSHSRMSGSRTDVSTSDYDESVPIARKQNLGMSSRSISAVPSKGTVRLKNINRFSNFVKSGMEAYILAPPKIASQPVERHEIIMTNEGPQWHTDQHSYSCIVDKPKKESKLKGLKSFIAYSLTSSLSGIQVSRRYKHFDWLHERLREKYILTPIPPLPEKQVSGRYEDDLIEHRKQILQLWVNKICRHPVLGKSDVWIHFVTCTDEKQWKRGKRRSEKDEYVGGNFFQSIAIPDLAIDTNEIERKVEQFSRMTRSLDESVRGLYDRVSETSKRMSGPYKANYLKLSNAFLVLAQAFEMDSSDYNKDITTAMKQVANAVQLIGDLHDQQPKKDLEPLLDALYAYKGMLSTVPDMVHVHKSAMSKLRENERLLAEGKISASEAASLRNRVDTISYAVLAEIRHFHNERLVDFKNTMLQYLRGQVEFHQQITVQLQATLQRFETI